jgi:hypothetical protein
VYVHGKVRPIETIPGMGVRGMKENDGGGKLNNDIRNFVNVTIYPQYNNNKIKVFKKRKKDKERIKK